MSDRKPPDLPPGASSEAEMQQAADWFDDLRDQICASFEGLEDALEGSSAAPGRFDRKPWQRDDGGRSFGFTGLHVHNNWRLPEYRRLVAQAILWTLKMAIPEGGINVDVPDEIFALD